MSFLLCHHCRTVVPEALFNTGTPVPCPRCQTSLLVRVFPAFFRAPVVGAAAEAVASAEDASCFYHPRKKAVVPCAECGRFLCALCDLEIDRRHVCPACATVGGPGLGLPASPLEGARLLHDSLALSLVVVPLATVVFAGFTLFTAPVTLFLVVRYWDEPKQHPLGRTRARLVVAALLASALLIGWGCLIYFWLRDYL